MNHIKDLNGKSVFFGDDFVIAEEVSEGMKSLYLYATNSKILLARKGVDFNFSSVLPGMVIADFSKH